MAHINLLSRLSILFSAIMLQLSPFSLWAQSVPNKADTGAAASFLNILVSAAFDALLFMNHDGVRKQ